MSNYRYLLSVLIVFAACSSLRGGVSVDRIDPASALEAGDYTGVIEGCSSPATSGIIACKKTEGSLSQEHLVFLAPPVKCKGSAPCVTFKIFFPDGSPAYGDAFPQGQTRRTVPWETLLKGKTFKVGDRGFWGYGYGIRYLGSDGIERTTYSQGELYLRVIRKGYVPLDQVKEDPHFVWTWNEPGALIKMTTGARTYIEPVKQ